MRLRSRSTLLAASALFLTALALSPVEVSVDNCVVSYDMQEIPTYVCDGHWARFGTTFEGSVGGIDASPTRYKVLGVTEFNTPPPNDKGQYALVVPAADRTGVGLADFWRAYVVAPWIVTTIRVTSSVLAVAALVALVIGMSPRRRRRAASADRRDDRIGATSPMA